MNSAALRLFCVKNLHGIASIEKTTKLISEYETFHKRNRSESSGAISERK